RSCPASPTPSWSCRPSRWRGPTRSSARRAGTRTPGPPTCPRARWQCSSSPDDADRPAPAARSRAGAGRHTGPVVGKMGGVTSSQPGQTSTPGGPTPRSTGPRIGILTSGGDSPGMNAAVRAVVRSTLRLGGRPFGILEGWRGALTGGDGIRELGWDDVGNLLHRGGTVLGSARCPEFRERDGLRAAALHLTLHEIDRLVVIGGDGSLRGAEELRQEWPSLQAELVEAGELDGDVAAAHPRLRVAGLV